LNEKDGRVYHAPTKLILYCAYQIVVEHTSASGDSTTIHGTAFYVKRNDDLFLITNRHNVDAVMKDVKYAGYKPTGIQLSGYFDGEHLVADLAYQEIQIGFPSNPNEDVAAINVTTVQFHVNKIANMSANYIDVSKLSKASDLSRLDICDMVALPGYPDFYDRNGNRPIVRMGTIASDPDSDYCDLGMESARRIAYEAFSSAGSSGSPVFALAKGFRTGSGLSGGYFRDLHLIGVNAGHLRGRDDMNSSHAGISYCFKSACIIDAIDEASLRTE
jgi:hypothetical protein